MQKKVLIVDDEKVIRSGMSRALHVLCGFNGEVRAVSNGRAAISGFYDVCFLDLNLRDSNGLEVMKRINEISPKTRIAVMTGGHLSPAMKKIIANNSSAVIPKPVDFSLIRDFLKQAISGGNQQETKKKGPESRLCPI